MSSDEGNNDGPSPKTPVKPGENWLWTSSFGNIYEEQTEEASGKQRHRLRTLPGKEVEWSDGPAPKAF